MIADGTVLVSESFDTSIAELRSRWARPALRGAVAEFWTFDSPVRRTAFAAEMAALGIAARARSAYKPLVHAFLEDIALEGADRVVIGYPLVKGAPDLRFRLEAYPVAGLIGGRALEMTPFDLPPGAAMPFYEVGLFRGAVLLGSLRVEAPNVLAADHTGEEVLSPTGWVRVRGGGAEVDERFETDLERAFRTIMAGLRLPAGEPPFFNRLVAEVRAPFHEFRLPVAEEHVSTAEAMHEDLYFSILEACRLAAGTGAADRRRAPGQIVPEIIRDDERVTALLYAAGPEPVPSPPPPGNAPPEDLARTEHWLGQDEIEASLAALGGSELMVHSRLGRPVRARHLAGDGPPLFVSAGQHPNETTGPAGALRAAEELAQRGDANLIVAPMMNPEGLELFARLSADFPAHMNHAARYTAGGNDLEYSGDGFEREMYRLARARLGHCLHLNLHGYPAHEWTRPFTGYLPRDFALWTLPKGFFLILRYRRDHGPRARALAAHVTERLAGHPAIARANAAQLARYSAAVPDRPFETMNGLPLVFERCDDQIFPITLITEAPDETVYGAEFRLWHEAQMLTVLAAHDWLVHRADA